jgi:hypothetical protein
VLIETTTFRLRSDVDQAAFLDTDGRVQTEFVYQQHGCVRRTTAKSPDGEWLVLTFWGSMKDAEDAERAGESDPLWREFMNAVDGYSVRRYMSLD